MFSIVGIIEMLFILVILYFILGGIILKFNFSSVKVMLLGIALIVFSNSVLKGMIKYGIDELISVIGLSFCIVGFFKGDR
jgi:energy-coupling factor transporter transmembrane protein EcfT